MIWQDFLRFGVFALITRQGSCTNERRSISIIGGFSRDPSVGPARSTVQMAPVSRSHVRLLGALAVTCGIDPVQAIAGFSKGFGDILSFVGIVIGLGTMIGGLLVSSGGADAFANAMISIGGPEIRPLDAFFCGLSDWLAVVFRSRVCSPGTISVRDGQEDGRADSEPRLTYACRSFHRAWDDSAAPGSNIGGRYLPR